MKKKLLPIFLTSLCAIGITGCKRNIVPKYQTPTVENFNKISKSLKNYDLSFNDVTYKNLLDELLSDVKGATKYSDIESNLIKALNKTHELIKKNAIANALYDYDYNNEEYEERLNFFDDLYLDFEVFRANLIYEIKDKPDILENFFSGYSEEDIEFEIALSEKKKESKYKQIKEELDDIVEEYDRISSNIKDSSTTQQVADLLFRFVNKNKELSDYLDFESYTYYQDINYGRIYTKNDIDKFISMVKENILPYMDSNGYVADIASKAQTLTYPEYSFLSEYEASSVFDKDYYTYDLLNDYSKNMGGDYYRIYKDFITNNVIFSKNEESLDVAYTNSYLSYFGPNYQNANTIVHEFGHFYSEKAGSADYKSLDLQEFYSQANEFLFMSYLEQNSSKTFNNIYDVESTFKLVDACETIVVGSALREFETKIYEKNLSSSSEILDIWDSINNNEYNSLLKDYWKFEIRYDLYYISYATSATGALSLYNYSKTNFKDSKIKYMSACSNQNMDDDIEEVLKKCNLPSPFDEQTFINIKELIEEKRK